MFTMDINIMQSRPGRKLDGAIRKTINAVAAEMFKNLKRFTPKRSGQAQRSWRKGNQQNYTVKLFNKQPYMGKLNNGYSKQAPQGFSKPAATATQNTRIRRND